MLFRSGQIGYTYLQNLSLLYTSGTNLLLFNSYAPVILFFLAAIFWRQYVPYLRQPDTMVWMFLLSILSAFGSSLLIYSNNTIDVADTTFAGDMLAILSTFFDVVTVLGQVQFIRQFPRTDGVLLNLHMFFYFFLSSIALLLLGGIVGIAHFSELFALKPALWSMGAGLFLGIGLYCNYEAFKRIDGYIAYILFNLSAVVTFIFEAFILNVVHISPFLILSTACTIFASIVAERINSRCEKEGV